VVRRYNEPVEVKTSAGMPESAPASPAEFDEPVIRGQPEAFVWRGRLYVVREVLAHWRERRAWWREALDPPPGQPHGIAAAARERQVWRVEASPGRLSRSGVFDLARDDPPEPAESAEPAGSAGLGKPSAGPAGPWHDPERRDGEWRDWEPHDRAGPEATPRHGPAPAGSGPAGWQLLRVAD
jgi:hypothetical protein